MAKTKTVGELLKVGLHLWPTTFSWPLMRSAAMAADSAGWDSLWTADHLLTSPDPTRPSFEGWSTIAALSSVTTRVSVGLLVGANTLRNPGLTAKLATTLDHISAGRAIVGLGAGWWAEEHQAFGIRFEIRRVDRVQRLGESAALIRRLLDGEVVTHVGDHYAFARAICRPSPVQKHLPILIGGSSPEILRTVVRHADMWNTRGSVDKVAREDQVLRSLCSEIHRDHGTIERTLLLPLVIRDSVRDARRAWSTALRANRLDPVQYLAPLLGEPERIADGVRPYLERGFTHIIVPMPTPEDHETIGRVDDLRSALG